MSFVGESGSGHDVVKDGPHVDGGRNKCPRLMAVGFLGMGGCTALERVDLFQRRGQALDVVPCCLESMQVSVIHTRSHIIQ